MNGGVICVLAILLLLTVNVSAQEAVNKIDYQQEVLELINQYGEDFDDCFPKLPSGFPDLSRNYTDLDAVIGEVVEKKWHHRSLSSGFFASEMNEIFFYMKWGDSQYAISIVYYILEGDVNFTIYSISFLGTDMDPNGVEFSHTTELLCDITESSLREIDVCKETPGFMFSSFLIAVAILLFFYSRYKK